MGFIENLGWRYATKEFDGRKVPNDILEKILIAIQFAPSSFGIQPYHITVVENDELKKKIFSKTFWDQRQIPTCSHLLIFCTDSNIKKRATDYVSLASEHRRKDVTDDPEFDYVNGTVEFGEKIGAEWPIRQLYIALGFAIAACAELKIDSCPTEAVHFTALKEIINFPFNLEPKVLLPIGYRSPNDKHAQDKKIRFSKDDLFDCIK